MPDITPITTREQAERVVQDAVSRIGGSDASRRTVCDVLSRLLGLTPPAEVPARDQAESSPSHDDVIAKLTSFADSIDRHGFVNAMGGHAKTLRSAVGIIGSRQTPPPWHWCDTVRPDEGRRVIILYEDGSGAFMGYWTGETLIDQDGEDYGWREEPGAMWAYLPKGYSLWCETRAEDPFTFPDTGA